MSSILARRDFVKMLALLAASTAARPEQIKAFEWYYDANTPILGGPFVAVDEVSISGLVKDKSTPLSVSFYTEKTLSLTAGLNAFGGIYLWRAGPDSKIVVEPNDFRWKMLFIDKNEVPSNDWLLCNLQGHIRYIDQSGVRCVRPIITAQGKLV